MAYTPDPTDVSQPVESVLAQTAAAEFRALKAYIQSVVSGGGVGAATVGQCTVFPGNIAPAGWLELDGTLKDRTTFANLWAQAQALGNVVTEVNWPTNYGAFSSGDLATNFRLPDWRGVFIRGWDHGRGIDTGRAVGSNQADSVGPHVHQISPTVQLPGTGGGSGYTYNQVSSAAPLAPGNVQVNTGAGPETRPINIAAMWCIKT